MWSHILHKLRILPLMALNSLYCADVPLSNYSLTHPHKLQDKMPCFENQVDNLYTCNMSIGAIQKSWTTCFINKANENKLVSLSLLNLINRSNEMRTVHVQYWFYAFVSSSHLNITPQPQRASVNWTILVNTLLRTTGHRHLLTSKISLPIIQNASSELLRWSHCCSLVSHAGSTIQAALVSRILRRLFMWFMHLKCVDL